MGFKEIIEKHIHKGAEKDQDSASTSAVEKESAQHEDDLCSSVDDGGGIVDEEKAIPPPSKRQRVKRHCGQFKWYYLAGIIGLLLVILLPILFKVIIPRIIKNVVNNQALPIISGSMVFTSSDSMSVALNTSLDTPLGVVIEPVGLALHAPQPEQGWNSNNNNDNKSPFVTVHMPEQHVHGQTEVEIPAQTAMIQDNTQLVAWFNDFFERETTELRVRTDHLVAHIGRLAYTVSMDKTIRVQGLNSLRGFGVSNMSFILPAQANGTNVVGTMTIPNPGVLTLGIGNVTFNLWAAGGGGNLLNLGTITTYDLVLQPGKNNTPSFQGILDVNQLVSNLGSILDSQSGPVSRGYIELNATGNSTFYNGRRISYIENVLNSKKLLVRIPTSTLVTELLDGLSASGSSTDSSSGSGSGSGSGSNSDSNSDLLSTLGQILANLTLLENTKRDLDSSMDTTVSISSGFGKVKRAMDAGAHGIPAKFEKASLPRLGIRGSGGEKLNP